MLTPLALADLVEFTEAAAYADMFRAAPRGLGLELDESDSSVALFAPGFDVLLFNRVLGLGLRAPAEHGSVEALIARYRAAGLRNFGIQVSPEAQPRAFTSWLEAGGLRVRDFWTKVYRPPDPRPAVATDLRLAAIDATHAEGFGAASCLGFGMPAALVPMMAATVGKPYWHHYVAWGGSTIAAVAALFVQDEVGWLGRAATLPEFRRRGAQGALMARRIADGAHLGCKWFVTETGQDRPEKPNPSFHNMMRTGFTVAYQRPNYMLPKPPA